MSGYIALVQQIIKIQLYIQKNGAHIMKVLQISEYLCYNITIKFQMKKKQA